MFKTEVKQRRKVGKLQETTLKVTRSDKQMMDPQEVKQFMADVMEEAEAKYPNYKMRVRGLNAIQWWTMKTFQDEDIYLEEVDDYLNGRVKDNDKFGKMYQLEIVIIR